MECILTQNMAGREGGSQTKQASKKQLESKQIAVSLKSSLEIPKFQANKTDKISVLYAVKCNLMELTTKSGCVPLRVC